MKNCADPNRCGLGGGFLQHPRQRDELPLVRHKPGEGIPFWAGGDQIQEPPVMRPDALDVDPNWRRG
jgi:hypothetical protein